MTISVALAGGVSGRFWAVVGAKLLLGSGGLGFLSIG